MASKKPKRITRRTTNILLVCLGIGALIVGLGLLLNDVYILRVGLWLAGFIVVLFVLTLILGEDHPIWKHLNNQEFTPPSGGNGGSGKGRSFGGGHTSGGGAGRGK